MTRRRIREEAIHLVKPIPAPPILREPKQSLTARARDLYCNRRLAAKWVRSVRYLRSFRPSKWVLDGARTTWGHGQELK